MEKYIIYVDGFNLYYSIKKTKYKWLDLKALVQSFNFKDCDISKIRYFTAEVIATEDDRTIKERQDIYLRALRTIPELEIHFGKFKRRTVKGKLLAEGNSLHKNIVEIEKFEEKGSDVNIATFMLVDCFQAKRNIPVLISNDSDLAEPLKYIKTILKMPVGLVTPTDSFTTDLKCYSSFQRRISEEQLKSSQFPHTLKDSQGEISCPKKWL